MPIRLPACARRWRRAAASCSTCRPTRLTSRRSSRRSPSSRPSCAGSAPAPAKPSRKRSAWPSRPLPATTCSRGLPMQVTPCLIKIPESCSNWLALALDAIVLLPLLYAAFVRPLPHHLPRRIRIGLQGALTLALLSSLALLVGDLPRFSHGGQLLR